MSTEEILGNLTSNTSVAEKILFSWFDYSLFGAILCISAGIGVYFGFFGQQDNVTDYILGGKKMNTSPIAMSLIARERNFTHLEESSLKRNGCYEVICEYGRLLYYKVKDDSFRMDAARQQTIVVPSLNTSTLPISVIKFIFSDISAMAFIGIPSDIYLHGASVWLTLIAIAITGFISYYVYLPVFYKLQLMSCFEYLKLRFDEKNCMFASFLMCLSAILHLPITIYMPALAFSQVTDINIHLITPVVSLVCIFYTTIGGLKAVVWTDTIQFSIMSISMIFVLILAFMSTGGIQYVFEKAYNGGRLFLWDFDLDPTNRTAVWSPVFGMIFSWTAYVVASQICNQKFQALPSYENVKWSMIIFISGLVIVKSISNISGLIIYAKYADCDPISTQKVSNSDQMFPYYIMDVAGKIQGLPGLFLAGIFCAALSSMSTDLNTLSGLLYEDFIRHCMPENTTEKRASNIMKMLAVVLGVFAIAAVPVIQHLGAIFPLAISMGDMTAGPLLGMFSLGMLVPVANSKGTLIGAITALISMGYLVFGAQYHIYQGGVITPELPTSVDGCDFDYRNINTTTTNEYSIPWIYRISFYYYTFIGMAVNMIVGVIVSILTGGKEQKVDRDLLSPVIYRFLPEEGNKMYKTDSIVMETINKK